MFETTALRPGTTSLPGTEAGAEEADGSNPSGAGTRQ